MKPNRMLIVTLLLLALLTTCGSTTPTPPPSEDPVAPTATAVSDEPTAPAPTPSPTAPPAGPSASVLDLINQVDAHSLPAAEWQEAQVDMIIYSGGEVWAQEESTARVKLPDGVMRVAPNTIFTFGQPAPDTITLDQLEGQIWLNIEGLEPDQTFEIETPNAVTAIRGTRLSVRTDPIEGTLVSTQVGSVTVSAEGQDLVLGAGLQSTVPPGGPPAEPAPIPPVEQALWGMAVGADLNVLLPAVHLTRTIDQVGRLSHPTISPDGRYLASYAYTGHDPGQYGTVFYDLANGQVISGVVPLDADGSAFSPDGTQIAYQLYSDTGAQICTVSLDGGERNCFGGEGHYGWPYWSPDGEWIAFYRRDSGPDEQYNIYRARPDGSDLNPLTTGDESEKQAPEWSPDGGQIAYIDNPGGAGPLPGDLWIADADGSNPRKLLDGVTRYYHPAWKPDGSLLAVRGLEEELWLVPADGSDPWLVPETTGWKCTDPSWAPNEGGWPLLFYRSRPDNSERTLSYLTGPDAAPQTLLDGIAWGPVWSADAATVAFGLLDDSSDPAQTTVLIFQAVADFYP